MPPTRNPRDDGAQSPGGLVANSKAVMKQHIGVTAYGSAPAGAGGQVLIHRIAKSSVIRAWLRRSVSPPPGHTLNLIAQSRGLGVTNLARFAWMP